MEQLFYHLLTFLGENHKIETTLFGTLEDDCHGTLLMKILIIIGNFLLGGILVAGTIGIIICGIQIIVARDNASMVVKAKKRLIDVATLSVAAVPAQKSLNLILQAVEKKRSLPHLVLAVVKVTPSKTAASAMPKLRLWPTITYKKPVHSITLASRIRAVSGAVNALRLPP